jgi:uridylate kinase
MEVKDVKSVRIVLRIGGSIVASPINPDLINKYVFLLKKLKDQEHEIAVIVGGGALAREFIDLAKGLGLPEEVQDMLAISVSRLFAQLFSKKLGKNACKTISKTIEEAVKCLHKGKIAVMGGLKPGMTTDTVAALIAERIRANWYIKATNQDGVYDKDPEKYADAVKLDYLSFDKLSEVLTEKKHKAGIHQILDPEAIKLLKKGRVKVIVINGFKPENVFSAIRNKKVGTIIK